MLELAWLDSARLSIGLDSLTGLGSAGLDWAPLNWA